MGRIRRHFGALKNKKEAKESRKTLFRWGYIGAYKKRKERKLLNLWIIVMKTLSVECIGKNVGQSI